MKLPIRIDKKVKFLILLWILVNNSCQQNNIKEAVVYKYFPPKYDLVKIEGTSDTISFALNESTYNSIKSFNVFERGDKEYISFYDDRSGTINIYNLVARNLVKRISLKKSLGKQKLYKTTTWCKGFDSIFVTNKDKLYLLDSAGKINLTISFIENTRLAYATFENTYPAVFKDNILYTGVRPYVDDDSYKALRKWKVLYAFDLQNKTATLHYHLPAIYHKNLYGYQFLDYNYCFNNNDKFIFSFPADTNIYASNLKTVFASYFARSQAQTETIKPLTRNDLENDDTSYKKYITQDSYGPIYFDPNNKRYLRVVKLKISEEAYEAKDRQRKYQFMIFNEQMQIIGESPIPEKTSYTSIFFSKKGYIYARVNPKDEYALHFVRMIYKEKADDPIRLAQSNSH